jgi:hypothetical protein
MSEAFSFGFFDSTMLAVIIDVNLVSITDGYAIFVELLLELYELGAYP